ncbi:immediate early response gene 2 protein [Chamaea fasciata]|uniref:immediate early response gene 2 protein n=1 Tax=Chamaea fasciata TaxID=190680 RepID=UPI003369DFA1
MEEAQRLLTVSVWKLYRCRLRRGGLRLHRSLQLSLLVRAARHRYLSARAAAETLPGPALPATPERGDPRNARCPNEPTAERPQRPEPAPRTEQEWGNPLRDCPGDHRNLPTGAPRSEWDRRCPPRRPTEDPPSPPSGDSPAPRPADPANRDRGPPAGGPRAGQKRRSSGSAGPGPGPVPSKRARLEAEAPPLPPGPPVRCSGPPAAAFGFLLRAVGAC